jgi:hypothetical protein
MSKKGKVAVGFITVAQLQLGHGSGVFTVAQRVMPKPSVEPGVFTCVLVGLHEPEQIPLSVKAMCVLVGSYLACCTE